MGLLNPLAYLKEKGPRRAFQVIWRFKLPRLQVAIVSRLTRNRPLDDKIVIESHNDFDCNGGAFYDWLIESGCNERLKLVWRLYHDAPASLPENISCVPVYGPSWRKAWAVCTARWLTADCTVVDKVRDDQVSVYMTHGGFGLKNCHGMITIPRTVDYVLSSSPSFDGWTRWIYEIESSDSQLVHVGFPSLDRLYTRRHSRRYRPDGQGRKTILWMPTFRQAEDGIRADSSGLYPYGVPLIRDEEMLSRLASVLELADVRLVIKLHPKQNLSMLSEIMPTGIDFVTGASIKEQAFDNYDLMLDADAMIGDYSAAIYEYLVLDRPVAFVLSDLEEYRLGLVEHAERYMAGSKIYDFADLERFIFEVANGTDSSKGERETLLDHLYEPATGDSCERVAALLGIAGS